MGVVEAFGAEIAAAETIQKRLNPTTPDASTVRGPRYSQIFKREISYSSTRLKKIVLHGAMMLLVFWTFLVRLHQV